MFRSVLIVLRELINIITANTYTYIYININGLLNTLKFEYNVRGHYKIRWKQCVVLQFYTLLQNQLLHDADSSLERKKCSVSQQIRCVLWHPKIQYRPHKILHRSLF